MNKKLLAMLVISLILLSSFPVYAAGATLELEVDTSNVLLNGEVNVNINLTNPIDIAGGEIIVNYDSDKLELNSKSINLTADTYYNLQEYGSNVGDTSGKAKIIFGLKKDEILLNSSKTIATLSFTAKALGDAVFSLEGSQLIKSNGVESYTYDTTTLSYPLTITIYKMGSISGKISLDDGMSPESESVSLFKGDTLINTSTLDSNGNYSFTDLEDGIYTVKVNVLGYLPGVENGEVASNSDIILDITLTRVKEDVNKDGSVDVTDLVYIGNIYGADTTSDEYDIEADVNRDNKIDILDLIYITRKIQ